MKGLNMKRYIGITALVLTLFLTLPALALEQVETVTWEDDVFDEQVVTIPAAEVPNGYTLAGVEIDFTETSCSWTAFWDGVPMPIDLTWTLAWYYEWFGGAGVGGTHEETALIDDAGTEFFMTTPAVYLDTNPIARRYLVDWDITARVTSSYSLGGSGTLSARDHLWRGEITVTYTFSESKGIN